MRRRGTQDRVKALLESQHWNEPERDRVKHNRIMYRNVHCSMSRYKTSFSYCNFPVLVALVLRYCIYSNNIQLIVLVSCNHNLESRHLLLNLLLLAYSGDVWFVCNWAQIWLRSPHHCTFFKLPPPSLHTFRKICFHNCISIYNPHKALVLYISVFMIFTRKYWLTLKTVWLKKNV